MVTETLLKIDKEIEEALNFQENLSIKIHDTSFRSIFIYEYLKSLNKPVFIITPSSIYSERLAEEIIWLSCNQTIPRLFPSWGIIPYSGVFPVIDIQAERITTISEHIYYGSKDIIIGSAKAILPLLPSPEYIRSLQLKFSVGDKLNVIEITHKLVELGYTRQNISTAIGEFSVRGGIIDIYPPNTEYPIRIELFSDVVESIRYYMVTDQRSFKKIESAFIPPVTEFFISREEPRITSPEEFMYERRYTIFDYLDTNTEIMIIDPIEVDHTLERYTEDIHKHHRQAIEEGRRVNQVESIFLSIEDVKDKLKRFKIVTINYTDQNEVHFINLDKVVSVKQVSTLSNTGSPNLQFAFEYVKHLLKLYPLIVIIIKNKDRFEHLVKLITDADINVNIIDSGYPEFLLKLKVGLNLIRGGLEKGFIYEGIPFVTENDLFHTKKGRRRKQLPVGEPISLDELKFGTFIVHKEYGIGKLIGTKIMQVESTRSEFIEIEYRDNARLYMPVEKANMLSQYIPSSDFVPILDRLGGNSFAYRVKKIRQRLYEIAKEFINNQAIRELKGGYSFSPPDTLFQSFEEDFSYDETPDQKKAIEDVLNDMISSKPMDRLICGDSGYGKTEVAMRAAFKAVMDNKQVALLAPTTILSEQHYRTFTERFKNYPVRIDVLNRFKAKKERNRIINKTANGEIDILIGTHSILKEDVRFKSLGLIIIDEEHKFGVDHKEALKKFNPFADILVITATPIPRTLKMALTGIKDISIITTPPQDRKATQCYIMKYNESVIRDIILKELQRDGQVFIVRKKIRGLEKFADRITSLVPDSIISVAHGQMPSKELDRIMTRFVKREINVLVSTAIIESGLDIPTANTIIIVDADEFGTSELYQLKGRVGRSDQTGYVYFILPFNKPASPQAIARLKLIASSSELSSGFKLAIHDMEMRGAGNIVGKAQSGHIDAIGLELYSELVKEAMLNIKGETHEEAIEPHINFPVPAYIPDTYINDPELRLLFYRRIANAEKDNLSNIISEMQDRFGRIPLELELLIKVIKIKILMKRIKASKLDRVGDNFRITFLSSTYVKPENIIKILNNRIIKLKAQTDMQMLFEPIHKKGIDGLLETLEILSLEK